MYDKTLARLTICSPEGECRSDCPMRYEVQVEQDCYRVQCAAQDAHKAISHLTFINRVQRRTMNHLAALLRLRLTPEDALLRIEEIYAMTDEERAEVYAALTRKEAPDGSDTPQSH